MPLRLYLYAAAALAIGFLVWREHHAVQRNKVLAAENSQLTATIVQERANRKIEQDDRRLADEIVKPVEIAVAHIATRPDPVGVFCRTSLPSSTSKGGSPTSTPSAAVDRGPEAPLRDIGSALGAARREAETNNAIHEGLIRFEVERTH